MYCLIERVSNFTLKNVRLQKFSNMIQKEILRNNDHEPIKINHTITVVI